MPNLNLVRHDTLKPTNIIDWLGLITSTISDLKGVNWFVENALTVKQLCDSINNDLTFAQTMADALNTKLDASVYTAADILTKIKEVDGLNSGLDADLVRGYVPVNKAGDTMTGALVLSGDPVADLQAATKRYVDILIQGLSPKQAVRVATVGNLTSLSGVPVIDGVSIQEGDRILVKDQNVASNNGIYNITVGNFTTTGSSINITVVDSTNVMYVNGIFDDIVIGDYVRVVISGTNYHRKVIDKNLQAPFDTVFTLNEPLPVSTGTGTLIEVISNAPWTRALDFDGSPENEIKGGEFVFVQEGTINGDSGFVLVSNSPVTFGTSDLIFTQFSGAGQIIAGTGLGKDGNRVYLLDTAVVPGTYYQVTVDQQGRVTSASNPITGNMVGDSDEQILSNKTLDNPKVLVGLKDANDKDILRVFAITNAVNYIVVYNNIAGNAPKFIAAGTDDNINLNLVPKGTGKVQANGVEVVTVSGAQVLTNKTLNTPILDTSSIWYGFQDSNSKPMLLFGAVPNSVNHFKVTNAATGGTPSFSIEGSDTNINLNLVPKGTGKVLANSVEVVTVTGDQTLVGKTLQNVTITGTSVLGGTNLRIGTGLRDGNGNYLLDFSYVTSSVNYLRVQNAATLGSPSLTATGSDTNVDLNLVTKGTGVVRANNTPIVTTTAEQTLSNKTLSAPKINTIAATDGSTTFAFSTYGVNSVNRVLATNALTGAAPSLSADGTDTDIDFNLKSKGTGIVKINSNEAYHSKNVYKSSVLSTYRLDKDVNDIYQTVEYKRSDGTLYMRSQLAGTSPSYNTKTETYFDTNGTTVLDTKVYTLNYNVDGLLESEVLT